MNIPNSKAEQVIQNAIRLSSSTQALINDPDLRDFLQQHRKTELLNNSREIEENISDLQNLLRSYTIKTEFAQQLPKILVDEKQLRQVLHNLIQNAIDAMPTGGTLSLKTQLESDTLKITVQDSGHGMSEKTQSDMFMPYFTTKESA